MTTEWIYISANAISSSKVTCIIIIIMHMTMDATHLATHAYTARSDMHSSHARVFATMQLTVAKRSESSYYYIKCRRIQLRVMYTDVNGVLTDSTTTQLKDRYVMIIRNASSRSHLELKWFSTHYLSFALTLDTLVFKVNFKRECTTGEEWSVVKSTSRERGEGRVLS